MATPQEIAVIETISPMDWQKVAQYPDAQLRLCRRDSATRIRVLTAAIATIGTKIAANAADTPTVAAHTAVTNVTNTIDRNENWHVQRDPR